jgi:hypothetical protein
MKKFKLLLPAIAFSFILSTSCKKDMRPDATAPATIQTESINAKNTNLTSAQLKARLDKALSLLPAGQKERLITNRAILFEQHPEYRDFVRRSLNLIPTPCNSNTLMRLWLNQELADWDDELFDILIGTGMYYFPLYDAIFFANTSANQYFGVNGEYSQRLTKTFKDLKRFWNIQSDGIILAAMHGNMLLDRDRVIRIDRILYGDSQEEAEFWADLVLEILDFYPEYRNGDHPIFTFNAFADRAFDFPPYGRVPQKIVMGDGIMQAFTGIGFGDVAPQAILAHEFGHHIQFQLNLITTPRTPEGTRRTELMADAYAAYFLSHSRGASMQWKRVKQFLEVFFNIGDCAFTDNGHHGTPTQRMAAAEWAYNVANDAQKQGHILTAQQFTALFEAQLPILVTK